MDDLEFKLLLFDELTCGPKGAELPGGTEALSIAGCFVMDKYSLLQETGMHKLNWEHFIRRISMGYLSSNPYHCALHGADVMQTALWLLMPRGGNLKEVVQLENLDVFSLLFAACIHDYEHPGTNNTFLTKTGHKLAVIYNDHNVLEMHHVAATYKLIHETPKEKYLFKDVADSDYSRIREIAVSTVLATDITNHFKDLGLLRSLTQRGDFLQPKEDGSPLLNKDDKMLILNVTIHTCDVSNPSKSLATYLPWAEKVLGEFFGQGEREKEAGLPVSNFMDRETTNIAKCQIGFINVLVNPLFTALTDFLPLQVCLTNLSTNRQFWEENVHQMEIEMLSGRQEFPPLPDAK